MPNLVALNVATRGRRLLVAALTVWFTLALVASLMGALRGKPAPVLMGVISGLTALCLLVSWKGPSIHTWAKHVSFRVLVGFHAVRFVGIAFLVLHARGELGDFALTAGWGDILVAIAAIAVILFVLPIDDWRDWWIVLGWNVFGLADIFLVVVTAARLGLADLAAVDPLTGFPMSLLPTFLVPLIISTHLLIFWRLWRTRRRLHNARQINEMSDVRQPLT